VPAVQPNPGDNINAVMINVDILNVPAVQPNAGELNVGIVNVPVVHNALNIDNENMIANAHDNNNVPANIANFKFEAQLDQDQSIFKLIQIEHD